MPPGPAYNWFCVAYSALNVLSHAAHYRVAQAARITAVRAPTAADAKSRQKELDKEPPNFVPQSVQHNTENDVILTNRRLNLPLEPVTPKASGEVFNEAPAILNDGPSEDIQPGTSLLHDEPLHKVEMIVGVGAHAHTH